MKKQLFFGLLMGAAAFFTACNADNSASEEAEILDSKPTYSIRTILEGFEKRVTMTDTDGIVTTSPEKRASAGTLVTMTVHPELIGNDTDDLDAESAEAEIVYWFVGAITGAYSAEGGPERTNVAFRPSLTTTNVWTFRMPPGDLTVDLTFTTEQDKTSASLSNLYVSTGELIPEFAKNVYSYTVALPFGETEFSIAAQAENPYLDPFMQRGGAGGAGSGDNLLEADLMSAASGGPLPEGLSQYAIEVTSEDGKTTETYNISVIQLPDLSLETLKITKADDGFERDLAPIGMQTVYIPYTTGFNIAAVPKDRGAVVDINPSPGTISSIQAGIPTTVTVTVSKSINGVSPDPAERYTLNLQYSENSDLKPLASGGYAGFVPGETEGTYYEVHTFLESGKLSTLSFFDKNAENIEADILLVAGGGGSGGDDYKLKWDGPGGGGAGGLLYETNALIGLADASTQVYVGKGGIGGGSKVQGNDGEASWIGTSDSKRSLTAPGGGGGGAGGSDGRGAVLNGRPGGSGGGGGSGYVTNFGTGGDKQDASGPGNILGNSGSDGSGHTGANADAGGGGGGAGSAGGNPSGTNDGIPGAGGAGWIPSQNNAGWISTVTGVSEFSHGGRGGNNSASEDGKNFGDGGTGGGMVGGSGHDGIVIIRFPHPGNTAPVEDAAID